MKYYLRRIAFVTLGAFIVAGTTSLRYLTPELRGQCLLNNSKAKDK